MITTDPLVRETVGFSFNLSIRVSYVKVVNVGSVS